MSECPLKSSCPPVYDHGRRPRGTWLVKEAIRFASGDIPAEIENRQRRTMEAKGVGTKATVPNCVAAGSERCESQRPPNCFAVREGEDASATDGISARVRAAKKAEAPKAEA